MKESSIIQIDDILVSSEIVTEYFACDYEKCKGACCIIGDSGAPMKEEEAELMEKNYDCYKDLMTPQGRKAVDEKGFFEIDFDGDIVTPLVPGTEECAFSAVDANGGCFCCSERAYCEGRGDYPKPISCRLYPIRVTELSNGTLALNYHQWDICRDARERGKREGIRVYQFLKEVIEESFGEEFYEALDYVAKTL